MISIKIFLSMMFFSSLLFLPPFFKIVFHFVILDLTSFINFHLYMFVASSCDQTKCTYLHYVLNWQFFFQISKILISTYVFSIFLTVLETRSTFLTLAMAAHSTSTQSCLNINDTIRVMSEHWCYDVKNKSI